MKVVGKKPRSWARVHKEINTRFKNRLFTGHIAHKERSNREPYLQLLDVTELGTEKAQERHKKGTTKAQKWHRIMAQAIKLKRYA